MKRPSSRQIAGRTAGVKSGHYHLLVETPTGRLLRAMRQLNGVYTQDFTTYASRCQRLP